MCIDRGVRKLLIENFPNLDIVEGNIDANGIPDNKLLGNAFSRADYLIHGSGPSVVASRDLISWSRLTGKPYSIFGVTVDPLGPDTVGDFEGDSIANLQSKIRLLDKPLEPELEAVLWNAESVVCRDTISRDYLLQAGLQSSSIDFSPDATFACDVQDVEATTSFLSKHRLEKNKYICIVPRLRWTPYHQIHHLPSNERTTLIDSINERTVQSDHQALRELIVGWVSNTDCKVLLCPEMTYQVQLAKTQLYDPLPKPIRRHVVWRDDYWLIGEASSTYANAIAVVSLENHSPIFALTQGTPIKYIRQPTDTIKGQMWHDLGMSEWIDEIAAVTGEGLLREMDKIHLDLDKSRQQAREHHSHALELLSRAFRKILRESTKGYREVETFVN